MCFTLVRLADTTIAELRATPAKAQHFWMQEYLFPPEPVGVIGRLFGKKEKERPRCVTAREEGDQAELDKSWDALDYLISEGRNKTGIARFLTEGGIEIPEDLGYGGPRVFTSGEVRDISRYLEMVSLETLRVHYDAKKMDDEQVYPQFWFKGGADLFAYVEANFCVLKDFVREAAGLGAGLMIICS